MKPSKCPFCGGDDVYHHIGYADITYIVCPGCGAVVSFAPMKVGDAAIRAYNRRADGGQEQTAGNS